MPDLPFDDRIAKHYEALWPEIHDPAVIEPAVDFLAEFSGDGSALELGIGTGRIALPLADRGVRVHGIELSAAMIDRRGHPRAQAAPVAHEPAVPWAGSAT